MDRCLYPLSKKERALLIKVLEAHLDDIVWATEKEKEIIKLLLTVFNTEVLI